MSFGRPNEARPWTLAEVASRAIIKRALELGMNFFDTANADNNEMSEVFLGRALREFASSRDQVVIATKVFLEARIYLDGTVTLQDCLNQKIGVSSVYIGVKNLPLKSMN